MIIPLSKEYYDNVIKYLSYLDYYNLVDERFRTRDLSEVIQLTIALHYTIGISPRRCALEIYGKTATILQQLNKESNDIKHNGRNRG